jgi:hypothetical protein
MGPARPRVSFGRESTVSADRIKKVMIAVAVVCLVVWLVMMVRILAATAIPIPPV